MTMTVKSAPSRDVDVTAPAYLTQEAIDHVWIHSVPWIEVAEKNGMHVFDRGEGSTIYDVEGKAYLDGIAGLWVVNAGHGRTEIGEAMGIKATSIITYQKRAYRRLGISSQRQLFALCIGPGQV